MTNIKKKLSRVNIGDEKNFKIKLKNIFIQRIIYLNIYIYE